MTGGRAQVKWRTAQVTSSVQNVRFTYKSGYFHFSRLRTASMAFNSSAMALTVIPFTSSSPDPKPTKTHENVVQKRLSEQSVSTSKSANCVRPTADAPILSLWRPASNWSPPVAERIRRPAAVLPPREQVRQLTTHCRIIAHFQWNVLLMRRKLHRIRLIFNDLWFWEWNDSIFRKFISFEWTIGWRSAWSRYKGYHLS
jgi:hypothetical protein